MGMADGFSAGGTDGLRRRLRWGWASLRVLLCFCVCFFRMLLFIIISIIIISIIIISIIIISIIIICCCCLWFLFLC